MSPSNLKPDLDESINVTEAHGRVVREASACVREKRIADNGIAPVSLWAFAACGAVLLVAGGILGAGGDLFDYQAVFRPGYVRAPSGAAEETGPEPKEALAAYKAKGEKIYSTRCSGCHGPDAKGSAAYPSLVGGNWPTGPSERFAMIILNGLSGPVENGKTYGLMPPQGIGMSAQDLAGVMTYVRNNFGNDVGDVITTEMAKAAMEISAERSAPGTSMTAGELKNHEKDLPGDKLDPTTMVDPVTLEPVAEP